MTLMYTPRQSTGSFWRRNWRWLATLLLLALAAVVLLRNTATLQAGFTALLRASPGAITLALVLLACSFAIAATLYGLLALRPLRYGQTYAVELAASAVNRVLPAGLGGLGVHGLYLLRRKHTVAQATVVVSVNNLLGITAHMLLLTAVVTLQPSTAKYLSLHGSSSLFIGILLGLLVASLVLVLSAGLHHTLRRFAYNLGRSLRTYAKQPWRMAVALALAMLLTTTYTAILFVCSHALDVFLSPLSCFVVFSIGMFVGTVTPTPGGLVGAEAGLFAGFVAYGVASPDALAAALLFRLVTYWLPIIPGVVALVTIRRRHLI